MVKNKNRLYRTALMEAENDSIVSQFSASLAQMVVDLKNKLSSSWGSFSGTMSKVVNDLKKGDLKSVSNTTMEALKDFNSKMANFSLGGVIQTIMDWLKKLWAAVQKIPGSANAQVENIKKALKNVATRLNEYFKTIMEGDKKTFFQKLGGAKDSAGVKEMWSNLDKSYKVFFMAGVALLIGVLSFLLVKPDMLEDAWTGFKQSMKNMKNGIVKAFKGGSLLGILKGILNIFLVPFKVIFSAIEALIDSGIGDLLAVCLILFAVSAGFMYHKITGKIPFMEGVNGKRIAKIKLTHAAYRLENI